ncbi:MAG: zincin-like metallopeptidase domain-containing protein [Acidimicrobiia bacterium]
MLYSFCVASSTSLHEHSHWSGHSSRLDRDLSGRFGEGTYAAEELVAELSAAFLCAALEIPGRLRHADYIGSWLTLLGNDKRAIFIKSKSQRIGPPKGTLKAVRCSGNDRIGSRLLDDGSDTWSVPSESPEAVPRRISEHSPKFRVRQTIETKEFTRDPKNGILDSHPATVEVVQSLARAYGPPAPPPNL